MDQLIFASLSHTHYWYEVGMLKVPAVGKEGATALDSGCTGIIFFSGGTLDQDPRCLCLVLLSLLVCLLCTVLIRGSFSCELKKI